MNSNNSALGRNGCSSSRVAAAALATVWNVSSGLLWALISSGIVSKAMATKKKETNKKKQGLVASRDHRCRSVIG